MTSYICFRVKVLTYYNQTVKICGNIPELGNWNPNKAMVLQTDQNLYPTWLNFQKFHIPKNKPVEFKCLIQDGENCYWENNPNRFMVLTENKQMVFLNFSHVSIEISPIKKLSEGSLSLNQLELTNARRVELGKQIDPFEMDPENVNNQLFFYIQKELGPRNKHFHQIAHNFGDTKSELGQQDLYCFQERMKDFSSSKTLTKNNSFPFKANHLKKQYSI